MGSLTREDVGETLETYIRAWEGQDPDLITTIFTQDATYHERVLDTPIRSRDAIRDYWQSKVVGSQARITVSLLSLYLDGDTAVAEWQAEFDDTRQGIRKRMIEVAVLKFRDGHIASLREYWAAESLGELNGGVVSTS
jgi:ketosteroid isomerase-like protein